MKPTNEQIQEILDGAPEGAVYVDFEGDYATVNKPTKHIHRLSQDEFSNLLDYELVHLDLLREILELRQEVERLNDENDKLLSKYGDNWYDGFMAAREYERKKGNGLVLDLTDDEILTMSEHAESEYANQLREQGDE